MKLLGKIAESEVFIIFCGIVHTAKSFISYSTQVDFRSVQKTIDS